MKKFLVITLVLAYACTFVYSASILDLLAGKSDAPAEGREGEEANKKTCLCNGPSCICCVDFNMSLIDLGGPGCVRLKYLGADEGVALNVSYGDSLLSSKTVKAPEPEPTCLNIFAKLAQMCAVFTELKPNDDGGLRGCLKLEPMLLEEVQLELPIGCFDMNADGMKEIEKPKDSAKAPAEEEKVESSANEEEEKKPSETANETAIDETDPTALLEGITAADIIAAVSESADQGISMISKWLGIKLTADSSNSTAAEEEEKN